MAIKYLSENSLLYLLQLLKTKLNNYALSTDLAKKVDKVDGKGLSTNDYTTTEKNKLAGIAEKANNYTLPTAGTTLGGVKTTSTVTSTSGYTPVPIINGVPYYKDTNTTYSTATTTAHGLMSSTDKKKLDDIEDNAQENVFETIAFNGVAPTIRNKVAQLDYSTYGTLNWSTKAFSPSENTNWTLFQMIDNNETASLYVSNFTGTNNEGTAVTFDTLKFHLANTGGGWSVTSIPFETIAPSMDSNSNYIGLCSIKLNYNSTADTWTSSITRLDGVEGIQVNNGEVVKNRVVKITVPTKVEELTDSNLYSTKSYVSDLVSKTFGGVTSIVYSVVDKLPDTGAAGTIYLVPKNAEAPDVHDEYIWVDDAFELIGSTQPDLTGYLKTANLTTEAKNVGVLFTADKTELTNSINNKVDKVSGKGLSTNDYTTTEKNKLAGLSNYTLPTASSTLGGVKTTSTVTNTTGYTPVPIINGIPYYKDTNTTYSNASGSNNGLMTSSDYTKLYNIASGAQVNVIETVKVNGTALGITNKAVDITVPELSEFSNAEIDTIWTNAGL